MDRETALRLAREAGLGYHLPVTADLPGTWVGTNIDVLERFAALVLDEHVDNGPWTARHSHEGTYVDSDDFTHDVCLKILGDFGDDALKLSYAKGIARQLNGQTMQVPDGFSLVLADIFKIMLATARKESSNVKG